MREQQRFAPGPKWIQQCLTAVALTLALAAYFHTTRSAVATATPHSDTAGLATLAESLL